MNIVGVTQGGSLQVFLNLLQLLESEMEIGKSGVFAADSVNFQAVSKGEDSALLSGVNVLKEWEIHHSGLQKEVQLKLVMQYEERIGDPYLWNALLADRRLFFGGHCKYTQDYKSRFSYTDLTRVLQESLIQIESFIGKTSPDLIVSFGTSTLGDYLFYLFAKEKSIPWLQLKATKIDNFISLNDSPLELSQHIFKKMREPEVGQSLIPQALAYIESVQMKGVRYEGAIDSKKRRTLWSKAKLLIGAIRYDLRKNLNSTTRRDHHLNSAVLNRLHLDFLNPCKYFLSKVRARNRTLAAEDLETAGAYFFYPLHFEPEVSIQLYGRPHQNQIELIRNISLNLPVGMTLLLKEHPRSTGFRPFGYYKKLMEMPNVSFVDISVSTYRIIKHATIVGVISGSTGLEAAVCKKPVITFGKPVYNILSNTMVRHVSDLNEMGNDIKELLSTYSYDQHDVVNYVAATISGSVPVDLYTTLLKKKGRLTGSKGGGDRSGGVSANYSRLKDYCIKRIEQECKLQS